MMNDILVDVRNLSITIDTFRGPLRVIRKILCLEKVKF